MLQLDKAPNSCGPHLTEFLNPSHNIKNNPDNNEYYCNAHKITKWLGQISNENRNCSYDCSNPQECITNLASHTFSSFSSNSCQTGLFPVHYSVLGRQTMLPGVIRLAQGPGPPGRITIPSFYSKQQPGNSKQQPDFLTPLEPGTWASLFMVPLSGWWENS